MESIGKMKVNLCPERQQIPPILKLFVENGAMTKTTTEPNVQQLRVVVYNHLNLITRHWMIGIRIYIPSASMKKSLKVQQFHEFRVFIYAHLSEITCLEHLQGHC